MALAKNQSDLLMTLYHGTMQDVPVTNPSQLQRLFFNTDLVTVKGVANQFQKSDDAQSKGNREMSICEMQHQVAQGRAEYMRARTDFLKGLKIARDSGIKLSSDVYTTDTRVPSSVSLGGIYCGLLRKLGVPALAAQSAPPPDPPQGSPQGSLPQGSPQAGVATPPSATQPQAGAKPGGNAWAGSPVVQPPVAGRITATIAPSSGAQMTPSMLEVTRINMADARTLINGDEIEIHKKFALAVACFVFVMLGAPIALRFPRGGVGLTLGVSLFVFALYYIGLTAGAAVAAQGLLPPVIAMWAANVIFAAVALILWWRMGNEGSTARGGDMREVFSNLREWIARMMRAAHLLPQRRTAA